ncbi:hypothetical protein FOCC_FOCC013507 [Frankliniella occidentalis]|uniref:Beta-3 adrenergic receptor-like n=1 Tax=Frankliniella occidentalis TaxID=133901 RepID=A0A6J1SUS6_FRAOC|nr:beta-3 adrenergic receptor-like [Frankliniella occidentalis]KAE8740981.1 hypothetical protein FOCC_FOCC013507 [Frankliniella occidentalis]
MAAIAVDRFTSLAQPLRYNNLITHRSVERYIAGLWLYAGLVGAAPLAARLWGAGGLEASQTSACSGGSLLRPPGVAVFLLCAVYAPCVVLVVGSYVYVYLVARTHHRAIYSVEISLRHAHDGSDAPFASRYTSTLAITVGLFVCLWLPFQVVMVVDLVRGSHLLSSLRALCLSLPLFASSALNPWVYGYRNGEVRAAVQRVLNEMFSKLGLPSSHLGCPHLMTTGADAELNSFASNARLCTMSAANTNNTMVQTGLATPSDHEANSLSPPGSGSAVSTRAPSPSPRKGSSSSTLLVPSGAREPRVPVLAPTASVITLAQTVIELRVPVPVSNGDASRSRKKVHHV